MQISKSSSFRWFIIFLLFFITIINYIDRAAISFAIDPIKQAFALSPSEVGYILGAFGIGYVVSTIVGGLLVDRYGARIILSITVLIWSLAMGWMGFALGFLSAFLARILLGVAEGPVFPALARCVGDWLPEREETRALSFSLLAVPFALMIGGPIVTSLITGFSWRDMFFILAVLSLIWVPIWWMNFRNKPADSKRVNSKELSHIQTTQSSRIEYKGNKSTFKFLLSNKTLVANYWAFFVFGYFLFFFMSWLPTYMKVKFHLDLTQVGLFDILPWLFALILMALGGYFSDKVFAKTHNMRKSRSHFIWISQLIAGLCILPIVIVKGLFLSLIFISLAVGFIMAANGCYFAINITVAHKHAGTALGIMDACFAVSGILAPIVTGWLITLTGHFEAGFLLMSLLALSSVVLTILWHHPERI